MEHYEKKISFLGENIQTIRKHRGMKQQELADKIGINMQSLSKIERGVNYPTFDTLEKIMDVLGVTPNELLSGEWKYIDHTEPYIMDIIKREQDFNVSLDYLSENEFFNDEKECRFYMETKLIQYIHNYITNEVTELEELMEITLKDDVLKVDGNFAIAWSNSLQFTVERTSKSLIGSAASGEGLVNVYRGTGKVLLAPVTKLPL